MPFLIPANQGCGITRRHPHAGEFVILFDQGLHLAFDEVEATFLDQRHHPLDRGRGAAEFGATVHQHDAARAIDEFQRPVER